MLIKPKENLANKPITILLKKNDAPLNPN
jgi:hypothetical protein